MNYAVVTKFLGPTNNLGSRVKAFLPSGLAVTLPWDSALSIDENHHAAATACVQKHVIDTNPHLSEKDPWSYQQWGIHGHKDGFVCLVSVIDKPKAV